MIRTFVRRLVLTGLAVFALLVLGVVVVAVMAMSEPGAYSEAAVADADVPAGRQRFEKTLTALATATMSPLEVKVLADSHLADHFTREEWDAFVQRAGDGRSATETLRQDDVNAWLRSQTKRRGASSDPFSDLRVRFAEDEVTFSFRMAAEGVDVIGSIVCRPRLDGDRLVLEIVGLRVGHLPLPSGRLVGLLADADPRLGRGVELDTQSTPPRLLMDVSTQQNGLRLAISGLRAVDGGLELTVRRREPIAAAAR